jgi:hypothetical protein
MDTENKTPRPLPPILTIIGAACWALAGPAVYKLVQSSVPLPLWAVVLLVLGGLLFLTAILVSVVPNRTWRVLISKISPWILYRRRRERQREQKQQEFLNRCLPTYVIHEPDINPQPVQPMSPKGAPPQYIAKFKITITNQPDCIEPIEVDFNPQMTLKQKWGYDSLSMSFRAQPSLPSATIPLRETREYEINMVGYPDRSRQPYFDFSQSYHWTIKGVSLTIAGLQKRVKCHSEGYINEEKKSTQ